MEPEILRASLLKVDRSTVAWMKLADQVVMSFSKEFWTNKFIKHIRGVADTNWP